MTAAPGVAYRILTADEWSAFQRDGGFAGSALDRADGFIHLSAEDQLAGTLATHFADVDGLLIARIDLVVLSKAVRWEASRGGVLFPHLYAPLPLTAVLEVVAPNRNPHESGDRASSVDVDRSPA